MEYCVGQGVPLRAAHERSANWCDCARSAAVGWRNCRPDVYEGVRAGLTPGVYTVLGVATPCAPSAAPARRPRGGRTAVGALEGAFAGGGGRSPLLEVIPAMSLPPAKLDGARRLVVGVGGEVPFGELPGAQGDDCKSTALQCANTRAGQLYRSPATSAGKLFRTWIMG